MEDREPTGCARTADQVAAFLDRAAGTEEHLDRCPACATLLGRLRAEPAVGPDLELRLLRAFRDWRDGPPA